MAKRETETLHYNALKAQKAHFNFYGEKYVLGFFTFKHKKIIGSQINTLHFKRPGNFCSSARLIGGFEIEATNDQFAKLPNANVKGTIYDVLDQVNS